MTRARVMRAVGPLAALSAVWLLFALLAGPSFRSWDNHRLMLLQTAVVGAAAVGATLIIISGGIDLSVGSTIALSTVVGALALKGGAGAGVGALACVGTGIGCGLVIGAMVVGRVGRMVPVALGVLVALLLKGSLGAGWAWCVGAVAAAAALACNEFLLTRFAARLRMSPFIVTLGMWGALRGIAKGLGDNQPVYPDSIGWIAALMNGDIAGLPGGVWLMLGVAGAAAALLRWTVLGRRILAIGGNETAARFCAVPVERTRLAVYTLGVGSAGVAGLLQFSYLSVGDPTTASGYELKAIAAAVIGGASLSGGEGSILGTLVGALIMTIVDNGCVKLGLDNWVQEVATGAIIVGAVCVDRLRRGGPGDGAAR